MSTFPSDFIWGAATASYQIEGAVAEDGRGPSIWDTFAHTPGKVLHGHHGDVACDHYHRYLEDIELMERLGIGSYRFSLAWPRLFPEGTGRKNPKGFDFYKRLIDALLEKNIQPAVTLYHWDLPQALQDAGGWTNRDTADHFRDYSEACYRELGDRVRFWTTLNEPFCSAVLGHLTGEHAPGEQDRPRAMRALHHLLLAHGRALSAFREGDYQGKIGIVLNPITPRPSRASRDDQYAAERGAELGSRMFLDPLYHGRYPERYLATYPEAPMPVEEGDMELIAGKTDYLGINYYTEEPVSYAPQEREEHHSEPSWQPRTEMGWPVVPAGLLRQLQWIHARYPVPEFYVTENGAAFDDRLSADGERCHDPQRIDYFRRHLAAVRQAIEEGIPVKGYFAWSLTDNFEWAFGYTKRFGLVYIDYVNQRRVPKDSFYFYRDLAAGHTEL
jgi:beta-glucosidase